ncbi:MurR/RpiR family transcriptional regulator [Kribbella shirazensis]|uniref:DNA-binding MurR/RpiR family transcriptional regulator n=1 Tax=Kribbella shirazensis TaxID=1105143 RepID=A0A7X5VH12_9ACTN|nr:MurR/RpiR family transcriptional regulator [Kribbella shirazensis]NIK61125.1 DNA-binding MurR/RpiR family transcriptional regulator [Kribbella shirazensis]
MTAERHRPAPRGAAFLTHVQAVLEGMPRAQQRLGRFAVEHPIAAAQMTITELADSLGTSPATVTRFYRALGLSSYSQLRLELATAAEDRGRAGRDELSGDIHADDSLGTIIEKMTAAYAQMIIESGRFLDAGDLERVARAILAARQVRIFGMGGAGSVARYLQGKLRSLGVPAIAFRDPREAVIDMANAEAGDVFLVISQSGAAEDAEHVLAEAVAREALTVALTSDPGSSIGGRADIVLRSVVREETLRTGVLSTRHVEMWLADCLSAAVLVCRFDESRTALTRVNEALGRVRRSAR